MKTLTLNWGWRIAIVYTVFAASTIGFVAFAMTEDVELVRKDYYEYSLKQDETQASIVRGNSVASDVTIDLGKATLTVKLPASIQASQATVTLYRPSTASLDKTYSMIDNAVEIPLHDLVRGHYRVVLEWKVANESYRLERAIEVGAVS
jgi:hypothetical protein